MRHFEAADLLRQGAGEGSSLVAEQLAFEQPGGNRGAVQADEGKIPPRTQAVDGARDQFLSGAGFAQDQHGGIGRRNHFHLPHAPASWPRWFRQSPRSCCVTSTTSSSIFSSRSRSRRSCTKVIQRNGESFRTAVATRTGTRVPSLRINSFSNGVQAPKRSPSSCASSSRAQVFRRRQIGPVQPAGLQILAAVSDQFEKRVVGLRNPVELAGNDAGDGRFRRDRPEPRAAAPQLFVSSRDGR